jgi:hypothetical protein
LYSDSFFAGMAGKYHLGQRPEFLPTARGFETYLVRHVMLTMMKTGVGCTYEIARVGHSL